MFQPLLTVDKASFLNAIAFDWGSAKRSARPHGTRPRSTTKTKIKTYDRGQSPGIAQRGQIRSSLLTATDLLMVRYASPALTTLCLL